MTFLADNPMNRAPRCTATSKRTGDKCKAPALRSWKVCRFHGARGGAPRGPAHGQYRHGHFTCEAIERRQAVAEMLRWARAGLSGM